MVNMRIPLDINNTLNTSSNENPKQIDEHTMNLKQQSTPTTPRSSSFDFNNDFVGNSNGNENRIESMTKSQIITNTNTIFECIFF